ncbi:hypothetical protein BJV74DRAFT_280065 [Russula compacta]|nr:hypothetical protein BJV74DRAFT_280065 [Russula compacta]
MSPGQPSASSKQRAHTVPLVSPTIRGRDLGQLMPSPGKASIVPPVHEVLRFSSLPCSFEPLAARMDVNTLSEKSEPDRNPAALQTEVTSLPSSHNELPSVATGLDVMTFTFAQLPAMTHQISPEGPDSDVTPKPTNQRPTSPSIVNPIPLAFGDPSSLSDDPPSPLSALSSLSELDPSPPPGDSEVHSLNVELPSGIPRSIQPPPSSAPSRATTKDSGEALPQVARLATATPHGRVGRGFMRSSRSARLTRSASTRKQKEVGSLDGDTKAKPQGVPTESSVSSSIPAKRSSDSPELAPNISKKSSVAISHKKAFSFAMPTSSSLNKTIEKAPASSPLKPSSLTKRQFPKLPSPMKPASSLGSGGPPPPPKHTGLSNLSLALEKLKIPPPSRPATTLGFNSDTRSASKVLDSRSAPKARDDSTIRLGNGLPATTTKATATPLRRVVTVGSVSGFGSNAHASDSKPAALIAPPAHSTDAGPSVKKINLHSGIIVGKNSITNPRGFVYGGVGKGRPFERVSMKSSLPVVEASPVKETGSTQVVNLDESALPSSGETPGAIFAPYKGNDQAENPIASAVVEPMRLQEAFAEYGHVLGADSSSAKDGQTDMWKDASRRASLASQFLQQTLAVLPSTPLPKASGSKSKASERLQSSSQSTRTGLRSGSNSDVVGSRVLPPQHRRRRSRHL